MTQPTQPTQPPPTQPPSGPHPPAPGGYGAPPPPASLHRSSGGRTIGVIVAGVVGVGVLGGLGAVVLGGDGGDPGDDNDVSASQTRGSGTGILDPEPVGTASPQPDPTADPTAPVDPAPTPDPTASAEEGDTATLGDGVEVFVPSGWKVAGQGANDIGLSNGTGSWAYVLSGVDDPAVEATAVLTANLAAMLPSENYSQLETSPVRPLEPFGSLVSAAVMDYDSLWVDAQSSVPLHGQVYVAVRQDGAVLLIVVEHTPPDEFESSSDGWGQVVDNTITLFGGS